MFFFGVGWFLALSKSGARIKRSDQSKSMAIQPSSSFVDMLLFDNDECIGIKTKSDILRLSVPSHCQLARCLFARWNILSPLENKPKAMVNAR
jgi:hypothetical protein